MMLSEYDLLVAGMVFERDAMGRIRASGPRGLSLRTQVELRMDAVRRRVAGGPSVATEARGVCDTCGLPMGVTCDPYPCRHPATCGVEVEGVPGRKCIACLSHCVGSTLSVAAHFAFHGRSNKGGTCLPCQCATQKLLDTERAAAETTATTTTTTTGETA